MTSLTGGYHNHGTVTELNGRTGHLVHRYSGAQYHFDHPGALAVRGGTVWVMNAHSVTRLPSGLS